MGVGSSAKKKDKYDHPEVQTVATVWLFSFHWGGKFYISMNFLTCAVLRSAGVTGSTRNYGRQPQNGGHYRNMSFHFSCKRQRKYSHRTLNTFRTRPHSKFMEMILTIGISPRRRPGQRVGFCWGYSVTTTNYSNRPGEWSCLNELSPGT